MIRLVTILALAAVACDGTAKKPNTAHTTQTAVQTVPVPEPPAPTPEEQLLIELTSKLGQGDELWATFQTDAGTWDCQIFWKQTPRSAAVFVGLATGQLPWTDPDTGTETQGPFYDGTTFFRTVPDFLIQGGDRTNSGDGGPGFVLPDEILPQLRFDQPGALAFANNGPNANGSQFFITLSPAPHLNDRHTLFGHCPELDVPRAIAAIPPKTDGQGAVQLRTLTFQRRFSSQAPEK